jgi:hypothetical protein
MEAELLPIRSVEVELVGLVPPLVLLVAILK